MKTKLLCIGLLFFIFNGFSQQIWKQSSKNLQAKIAEKPKQYESLILDKNSFLSITKKVSHRTSSKKTVTKISLPVGNSTFETFEILETSNFNKDLALKFPEIKSYLGKSTSTNKVARLSYSQYNGLTGFISTNHGTVLIKPTHLKSNTYTVFNKNDSALSSDFECGAIQKAHEFIDTSHAKTKITKTALDDGFLRKYRIAIATTGEYSNFFLTGSETSDTERKAVILAAINTTLTRINGIFERDFGITLELVPDNDKIIHLNASTDPFSSIGPQLTDEAHFHLDSEIGSANYDVGHVLAYRSRNYGYTYIGVSCVEYSFNSGKGSAFSSGPNLDSDDFYMIFAHELGHQFGAWHVQSNPSGGSCRGTFYVNGGSQVEPGSGSSIMSYAGAGLCLPEVKNTIDPYFNYVNIRDVIVKYSYPSDCAELISTGNNAPTVNAGNNYTIPKSTPFILEGIVNDIDNNSNLSYNWEQNNPEAPSGNGYPQSTWTQGPVFRSLPPANVPVRYMPKIEDVLTGNLTPTWEVLPSVSRSMNFVLTVRDNAPFGPKTASDEMTVSIDGNSGPFSVTSQQTSTTWDVGETQTVTWDVANTNQAPVNATTVAIYLSTDGGYTYPIEVATNVTNTGSYDIVVPNIPQSTSTARIMVKAEQNIFYAINAANISVNLSLSLKHYEAGIDGFTYFPNPVNHTLIIEANETITRIEIYNLIGQLMSVKENIFKQRTEIDLSHLSTGMYYIRSFSNEKKELFNIMKK